MVVIIYLLALAGLFFIAGVMYANFKGSGTADKPTNVKNSDITFKKIQLNTGLKLMATPGNVLRYYLQFTDGYGNSYIFVDNDGTYWPKKLKDSITKFDSLSAFNMMPKNIALNNIYYTQLYCLYETKDELISLVNRKLAGYAEISKDTEIDLTPKDDETISTDITVDVPSETEIITKMLDAEKAGDKATETEMLNLWEINYQNKINND